MNAYKSDYKAAINLLKRVDESIVKNLFVLLAFGDALLWWQKSNDAYSAYRNAFRIDNTW
jgi:predicted negative regulator of RcsB-dependent stress response